MPDNVRAIKSEVDVEPSDELKRLILAKKLEQLQAQGYESEVNAKICVKLGDNVNASKHFKAEKDYYIGAQVVKTERDALPDPTETETD